MLCGKHTGCWTTTLLEDMASEVEGCSMVMVAASQVGSCLDSLEDLNQPNILKMMEVESVWRREKCSSGWEMQKNQGGLVFSFY